MPTYQWNCPVCDSTNEMNTETCSSCGCSAEPTGREVEARRSAFNAGEKLKFIEMPLASISIQKISVGSIYKLWLTGLSSALVPLGMFFGLLSVFGYNTVTWNGQPIHGLVGLFTGPAIGIFLSLMFTVFAGTLSLPGLWLYSKKYKLSISVKNLKASEY